MVLRAGNVTLNSNYSDSFCATEPIYTLNGPFHWFAVIKKLDKAWHFVTSCTSHDNTHEDDVQRYYTLSEAWCGVNWADLMASQGASGTDFYDRSILRPKHRAYYRSGRPIIKIGSKGALGSHSLQASDRV